MKLIQLTKGYVAIVDDEDFPSLSAYNWRAMVIRKRWKYADRKALVSENSKTKFISMHRQIMNPPDGVHIDHIDGNGLNNMRSNLRLCTRSQNRANSRKKHNSTSGFKGITRHRGGKWQAQIKAFGKNRYLGLFAEAESAHDAYVKAAEEAFGPFARAG